MFYDSKDTKITKQDVVLNSKERKDDPAPYMVTQKVQARVNWRVRYLLGNAEQIYKQFVYCRYCKSTTLMLFNGECHVQSGVFLGKTW